MSSSYFFHDGLRFSCKQCGVCCTGDPGIVRVDNDESSLIAASLAMSTEEFLASYCNSLDSGHSLKETSDGACIFFDQGCRIYQSRPQQCRTFPFWVQNLRTPVRWEAAARGCPGIGEGRRFTEEEILGILGQSRL